MDKLKRNLKLHNPPFGYFSTIYITLVTIVQGIIFTEIMSQAVVFLGDNRSGSNLKALECLNAMVIVLIIWHKYANHHQITGWQVTIKDTFILFVFGIIEGLMVASLKHNWELSVHFWILLLSLFTTYAYWHAWSQLKEGYVKDIFVKYFDTPKENLLGEFVYCGMVGFETIATAYTLIFAVFSAIIFMLSFSSFNMLFDVFMSIFSIITLGYWAFVLDLNQWLCEKKWGNLVNLSTNVIDGKYFHTTLMVIFKNSLPFIKSSDKVYQYYSHLKKYDKN